MKLKRHALIACVFVVGSTACGGRAFPALLTTTVHRVEEQGIDYVAEGTSTLEITLGSDGRGRAIRANHGVDVFESDARTTDDTAVYQVRARSDAGGFTLALTPEPGQSPLVTPVELTCVAWTSASRAESSDATDPGLPGVEWVCELEGEMLFALGRVVVQHVPREGAFFLFGSSQQLVIEERMNGALRTVTTERGPPR